jgi:hypothetical protein
MSNETVGIWITEEQLAEHTKSFGNPTACTAKGKTEFFDKLNKHLTDKKSGLGWKEAWTLRLETLGQKNRLPRGFKVVEQPKEQRELEEAGRLVLGAIKQAFAVSTAN